MSAVAMALRWLAVLVLAPAVLWIAWQLLVPVHFGYPVLYSALDIPEHIAEYAPQNRHGREDFALTDREEHQRLFAEINQAVHEGGEELGSIRYRALDGTELGTLLRPTEVGHLEDVAGLIDRLLPLGAMAVAVAAAALAALLVIPGGGLPRPDRVVMAWGGVLAVGGAATAVAGPLTVFRQLHEWAFPEGAPWFFYYQDSLMTTLMRAPDLFFAIGALWAGLAAVLYTVLLALGYGLMRWNPVPQGSGAVAER